MEARLPVSSPWFLVRNEGIRALYPLRDYIGTSFPTKDQPVLSKVSENRGTLFGESL